MLNISDDRMTSVNETKTQISKACNTNCYHVHKTKLTRTTVGRAQSKRI